MRRCGSACSRPPGTPPEVIAKLQTEITRALAEPDAQRSFQSSGVDVATDTPKEFGVLLRSESDKWGKVVRDTKATIN